MINTKQFFIVLIIALVDIVIYIFLGLVLLGYEDFYDESKGEYWSLASMTLDQKAAYICWHIWFAINILLILFIIIRFVKQIKDRYFVKN